MNAREAREKSEKVVNDYINKYFNDYYTAWQYKINKAVNAGINYIEVGYNHYNDDKTYALYRKLREKIEKEGFNTHTYKNGVLTISW